MIAKIDPRRIAIVFVLAAIAGCASVNPLAEADTVEQRAFAVRGMFTVAREELVELVAPDSPVSENIQRMLLERESNVDVTVDSMVTMFRSYIELKDAYAAGETSLDRFTAVFAELRDQLDLVEDVVGDFFKDVEENK